METLTALGFCVIAFGLGFLASRLMGASSSTVEIDKSRNEANVTVTHEKGSISAGGSVATKGGEVKTTNE
jgi:hypothetical protein